MSAADTIMPMPQALSRISTGYSGRRSSPLVRWKKSGAIRIPTPAAPKISTLQKAAKASAR